MTKYKEDEQQPPQSSKVTPESVRRQNLNPYPESEVEAQSLLIAPQAGRAQIGMDLDKMYRIRHPDNRQGSAWDYFTAQTSDTRLSNLTKEQEVKLVRWALGQQGRCLMMGLSKSSANADWWRSTVCEPGLAWKGFLRNNIQTIRQESSHVQVEETSKSRSIFGFMKGGTNGQ